MTDAENAPTVPPITSDLLRIRTDFGAFLTEDEAADLLSVAVATLEAWRRNGGGPPFVELGDAADAVVRYPVAQLRQFLEDQVVGFWPRSGGAAGVGGVAAQGGGNGASERASAAPATSLRTVKRLAEELEPAGLSLSAIRWSIHAADRNGLAESGAIFRSESGRRLLIDRVKYEEWLRSRSWRSGRSGRRSPAGRR